MNLSIIVPCYNEAKNLPQLLESFRQAIGDKKNIVVLFVNNGSTDLSQDVFNSLLKNDQYSFARCICLQVNQGYGYGILQGLYQADTDYLAWTHADLQTNPQDVIHAFSLIINSKDPSRTLVKGKRIGRSLIDRFFTRLMSVFTFLVLGQYITEINAQPKLFHRSLLKYMSNPPYDFALDLYLLYTAQLMNMHIIEHPVVFDKRIHGESKGGDSFFGKIKLSIRTMIYIFHLRRQLSR